MLQSSIPAVNSQNYIHFVQSPHIDSSKHMKSKQPNSLRPSILNTTPPLYRPGHVVLCFQQNLCRLNLSRAQSTQACTSSHAHVFTHHFPNAQSVFVGISHQLLFPICPMLTSQSFLVIVTKGAIPSIFFSIEQLRTLTPYSRK